jgi:hypothetical protein
MSAHGLPRPDLNARIIESGEVLGTGDFVWRGNKVIADYDGAHHDRAGQRHQDAQTRDDYAATGRRHVTVTGQMGLAEALGRIERALLERGWRRK